MIYDFRSEGSECLSSTVRKKYKYMIQVGKIVMAAKECDIMVVF